MPKVFHTIGNIEVDITASWLSRLSNKEAARFVPEMYRTLLETGNAKSAWHIASVRYGVRRLFVECVLVKEETLSEFQLQVGAMRELVASVLPAGYVPELERQEPPLSAVQ